jgi:hypothetical protein
MLIIEKGGENGIMRNFNLYSSPNIRVNKSKRMKWVGHVACMGRMRNTEF